MQEQRCKRSLEKSVDSLIDNLEEDKTDPNICLIIKNRLIGWQHNKAYDKFPFISMSLETRVAMEAQDRLGWKPFIYGRTSNLWQLAQDKWICRQHTTWKKSSHVWAGNLILHLFHLIRTMWEHRNSILHDPNHIWQAQKRENWDTIIRQYFYTYDPDHWLRNDRRFFSRHLSTVLNYPDEVKQQWIDSVRKARSRFFP